MFERFSDNARKVMATAATVAREEKSAFIRRHHMLIGLLDDAAERPDGVPALMLADAGVNVAEFRSAVLISLRSSETAMDEVGSKQPFSGGGKKALELALREALSLGHNYIGCEHLLLAILRSADGPLAAVLATTSLRYGTAREFLRTYVPADRGRGRGRRFGRRGPFPKTPAVDEALARAQARATAGRPVNTGDLLVALSEVKGSHFARLLDTLPDDLAARADALVDDNVPDGTPEGVQVDPRSGALTVTDPDLAAKVRAMSPEKIAEALRKAVGDT